MGNSKIVIFNPTSDLHTNPSLRCLIEKIAKEGIQADIYVPFTKRLPDFGNNVRFFCFPRHFDFWSGSVKSTLRIWKWFLYSFSIKSRIRLFTQKYDLVIGIDLDGSFLAYRYCQKRIVPFIYLSYEIYFVDELVDPGDRLMKKREIIASRNASLVIIQDKWRAELLRNENNLKIDNFSFLPVAGTKSDSISRSNYLRNKYQIETDKMIVIHSGSFVAYNYANELIEQVGKWPSDFIVIIHTRLPLGKNDPYLSELQTRAYPNVILSTDPLSSSEYEEMVCSADIGLAFYKSTPGSKFTQKNIKTMGLSSGKVSAYTKMGLPVISVNQPCYKELIKDYKFGIDVDTFDEIPKALIEIKKRYYTYRAEAQRFFIERLDFDKHWPELWSRMLEIMNSFRKK